jgi:hypothetical protein
MGRLTLVFKLTCNTGTHIFVTLLSARVPNLSCNTGTRIFIILLLSIARADVKFLCHVVLTVSFRVKFHSANEAGL